MVRKLINLIKNYDRIMALLDEPKEKTKKESKNYSVFNVPQYQLDYIEKIRKGGKR